MEIKGQLLKQKNTIIIIRIGKINSLVVVIGKNGHVTSENIDEKEAEVKSALAYFEAWRMACFSWSFEAKATSKTQK